MIDNQLEKNNPKLTSEQTQAIEETKLRLINLESEIVIANKNLKGIRSETEKITKERVYQEELLAVVIPQLKIKQEKCIELEEEIIQKKAQLNNMLNEMQIVVAEQKNKSDELEERENILNTKQSEFIEKEKTLNMIALTLETESERFHTKVDKLKEVISTF